MKEILFRTAAGRALAALAAGGVLSFLIGSFLSFFVLFAATQTGGVEGQTNDTAKTTVFRVYVALFLLFSLGIHFYACFWFRAEERKGALDFAKPRPAICGAIAVLFLLLNVFATRTETQNKDSFEHADNPYIREAAYGWPATFVVLRDEYGKKEQVWSRAFLLVNGLILLLAVGNVLNYERSSLTTREEENEVAAKISAEKAEKKKKAQAEAAKLTPEDEARAEAMRKAMRKESSAPQTLDLD